MTRILAILALVTFLAITAFTGEVYQGKIVGVSDGDTITVLRNGNTQVKIRLEGVDCPEKTQDFGQRAKQFTSGLVFGKTVTVQVKEQDRYGRSVATVIAPEGKNLNLELVKAGLAWHYTAYSKDKALAAAELEARAGKVGLWSRPDAVAPWEYRKAGRSGGAAKVTDPAPTAGTGAYWLNTKGNIRHNSGCKYFKNTKAGRPCGKTEGKACGMCGG
jgi:endonuclease YncB( thermonuclease family)